ncbi:RrF2 family transcriptional regulator [Pseudonocardia sp.]|jgi:Rrf2 family protein|uniref:RrF2 family transcriptional regulator n=1 Tax=Pseudonocardia sp. TaxID=60912 RepID=UPI003D0AE3C6
MSGGVEWALHCCVVLTGMTEPVPAARLAEFHDVSPTYLAKQLQALSRAGLVRSVQGQAGGYVLTRAATEITVLDVVEAVDGREAAFTCTEIRQRGPFAATPEACTTPCPVARVMIEGDRAWRESLRATSIAELAGSVARNVGVDALPRAQAWIAQRA